MSQPEVMPYYRQRGNVYLYRFLDGITYGSAIGGAITMLLLLLLLLAVIGHGAYPAYKLFGISFLTSTDWIANPPPLEEGLPPPPQQFGAYTAIRGTLLTSFIALLISFPVSMGSAIFLTKLAPRARIRNPKIRVIVHYTCTVILTLLGMLAFAPFILFIAHLKFLAPFAMAVLPLLVVGFLAGFFFLFRFALPHTVMIVSFMIELLAAIPSIAYGLWGIAVLAPFLQKAQPFISSTASLTKFPYLGPYLPDWTVGLKLSKLPMIGEYFQASGYATNITTAGIILAIMVTPIMTAIVRDVLTVSPPELEQGALGLGATWWQSIRLVLGFAKMGILGAVILGFARAIGETMAVTMVIGNSTIYDKSLFESGQSIASLLAVQFRNADSDGEIHALVYMAFVLLVITTIINGIARVMIVRAASRGLRK